MSFSDTIFLFFLALVLFGPKRLPEMAKKAGRLMAELRRASNEFKSQIETEIAHLEVEKSQTVLSPAPAPAGSVASTSLNPTATLAGPTIETASQIPDSLATEAATPLADNPPAETPAEPSASTSQESHV